MGASPSQYSFACPDCGTDSPSSEYFFMAYAGRKVTRWCDTCQNLFDVEVPHHKPGLLWRVADEE